jgi:hypothetical protein
MLCLLDGMAQTSPTGINYQAVARGTSGTVLASQDLDVKFQIRLGSATGTLIWEEVQTAHTSEFGVFNLVIGASQDKRTDGTVSTFNSIDWSSGVYYLVTWVKFDSEFKEMGATQIAWVPYAYYALKSGTSNNGNVIAVYDATTKNLTINGTVIDLSTLYNDVSNTVTNISLNGNLLGYQKSGSDYTVDLSKFLDNTDNQNLSLSGQLLKISNGNEVTLPVQTLSIDQNTLKLSNNGGSVTIDPSPENEIQLLRINADTLELYRTGVSKSDSKTLLPDLFEERDTVYMKGFPKPRKIDLTQKLTLNRNQLSIKRGNTITLDGDTTNEIQDLHLVNDKLSITKNATATAIDLKDYKDNTDNQAISRSGNEIQITGNTSTVDITDMVNVPWVGFSASSPVGQVFTDGTENLITWTEDFDDGFCLDNSLFTANAQGVYNFSFNLILTATGNLSIKVYKNSTTLVRSLNPGSTALSHTMLLKLNAGETIQIKILNNTTFPVYLLSGYFSGYRVH